MLGHIIGEGVSVARTPCDTDRVETLAALIFDLLSRLRNLVITAPEGVPLKELLAIQVDARLAWVPHGVDRTCKRAGRLLQRCCGRKTLCNLSAVATAVGLVVDSHFEIALIVWFVTLHTKNDGRTSIGLFESGPLFTLRHSDTLGGDVARITFSPLSFVRALEFVESSSAHLKCNLRATLNRGDIVVQFFVGQESYTDVVTIECLNRKMIFLCRHAVYQLHHEVFFRVDDALVIQRLRIVWYHLLLSLHGQARKQSNRCE